MPMLNVSSLPTRPQWIRMCLVLIVNSGGDTCFWMLQFVTHPQVVVMRTLSIYLGGKFPITIRLHLDLTHAMLARSSLSSIFALAILTLLPLLCGAHSSNTRTTATTATDQVLWEELNLNPRHCKNNISAELISSAQGEESPMNDKSKRKELRQLSRTKVGELVRKVMEKGALVDMMLDEKDEGYNCKDQLQQLRHLPYWDYRIDLELGAPERSAIFNFLAAASLQVPPTAGISRSDYVGQRLARRREPTSDAANAPAAHVQEEEALELAEQDESRLLRFLLTASKLANDAIDTHPPLSKRKCVASDPHWLYWDEVDAKCRAVAVEVGTELTKTRRQVATRQVAKENDTHMTRSTNDVNATAAMLQGDLAGGNVTGGPTTDVGKLEELSSMLWPTNRFPKQTQAEKQKEKKGRDKKKKNKIPTNPKSQRNREKKPVKPSQQEQDQTSRHSSVQLPINTTLLTPQQHITIVPILGGPKGQDSSPRVAEGDTTNNTTRPEGDAESVRAKGKSKNSSSKLRKSKGKGIKARQEKDRALNVANTSAETLDSLLPLLVKHRVPKGVIPWRDTAPFHVAYFTVTLVEGRSLASHHQKRRSLPASMKYYHHDGDKQNRGARVQDAHIYAMGLNMPTGYMQVTQGRQIKGTNGALVRVLSPHTAGPFVEFKLRVENRYGMPCKQMCLDSRGGGVEGTGDGHRYRRCIRRLVRLSNYKRFTDPIPFYRSAQEAMDAQWTGKGYYRRRKLDYLMFNCE